MTRENKAGAFLVMLTCPCHAVMLIFVLGGTAVGSVLAAFRAWVYLGFTLLFLLGLYFMVRKRVPACDADVCQPSSG